MDKYTLKIIRGMMVLLGAFGTAAYICLVSDDGRGATIFTISFLILIMFLSLLGMLVIVMED